ncbi:MAG: class I SAM-dependent methyltransferase [Lachnospiraceae bacterium]|nr:class I SAM-dependent methyltransferase [Lachnospiraceae bacterium]
MDKENNKLNLTEEYYSYENPFVSLREYFSMKARNKIYKKFIKMCAPSEHSQILDLGATPDMKLKDSNFLEKRYPHKHNITVASIEDCSNVAETFGLKKFVHNKSKEALPFRNGEFEVCFCSATLEHVGSKEEQIFFLNECMRVADKIFLTTPNRYFPIEMHTFLPFVHWLPWSVFQKIVLKLIGPFYADINNLNLLSEKEIRKMSRSLSKEVIVTSVRTLGLKSNLIITIKER